ncbi:ATP citrate lyase citrate-binding domain-containing protein [Thiocystis violacea]|uniref:ATP citrate lyase citrate-binding domain-containing protein n=1 Tax=Thiocystis violacea TaxID=13725 RepID=UPI001F5BBEF4|nr:ATP citrate lyase citrate-binding domain-containing protein [Thiocystis violacea]
MSMLELNPIRMMAKPDGWLIPVACDFKCTFDTDDPAWQRLNLPASLGSGSYSAFELEVNELRTYQGQSDVFVINDQGSITAMTFGGGANALVTELLGEAATISSDFGGNSPYEKMYDISRIVYKHWLAQTTVLFMIRGKANNTDIYTTFRAMADALRDDFNQNGPRPLFVVLGRGGPNLIRGMAYLKDARDIDDWIRHGGREEIARHLGITATAVEGPCRLPQPHGVRARRQRLRGDAVPDGALRRAGAGRSRRPQSRLGPGAHCGRLGAGVQGVQSPRQGGRESLLRHAPRHQPPGLQGAGGQPGPARGLCA